MRVALFGIQDESSLNAALTERVHEGVRRSVLTLQPSEVMDASSPVLPVSRVEGEPVPIWFVGWDECTLVSAAGKLLRRFVFPLTHSLAPYVLAFSAAATVFAPRPLSLGSRQLLDLEDIGALLAWSGRRCSVLREAPVAALPSSAMAGVTMQTDLDHAQLAAALHRGGPVRVLAPAGSGKTKTMINRVAALVGSGEPPGSILTLAFNTKAAEQLQDRLERLGVPATRRLADTSGVHCATFNAFGSRYQREIMGLRLDVITDAALQERLLRQALWRALAPSGRPERRPPSTGRAGAALDDLVWRTHEMLIAVRADCRDTSDLVLPVPAVLLSASGAAHHHNGGESLPFAAVRRRIEEEQRRQGRQSFDDQILVCVADLLACPSRRGALQSRFRHVLVDEFQDLNAVQLALVDLLSRPHRELFVVGDDDQLIYGWRFAKVANILEFERRMPAAPHCRTIVLDKNYRCSRQIVERASALIAGNRTRVDKDVRCAARATEGSVIIVASPDWRSRAKALGDFLRDSHQLHRTAWAELAVLCRYRSQYMPVIEALRRRGVPCHAPAPAALFTHPAAALVRTCLAQVCCSAARPEAPALVLGLRPPVLAARLQDLRRWIRRGQPTAHETLCTMLEALPLEEAVRRLTRRPSPGDPAAADAPGPTQVIEAILLLSLDHGSPRSLLAWWDGEAPAAECPSNSGIEPVDDAVVVSTIHAAKGREYRSVVVHDYSTDLGMLDEALVEEERRVLYVALTRAQHTALITLDTCKRPPHRFIAELARPPSRAEAASMASELADLNVRLEELAEMAPAVELAALRLRRLELQGRLTEARLFTPPSRLRRAVARLGLAAPAPR